MSTPITRPPVLLFDVNETLPDIGPLKEKVGDLLQEPGAGRPAHCRRTRT